MRRVQDHLIGLLALLAAALSVADLVRMRGSAAGWLFAGVVTALLASGLTLAVLTSSGRTAERLARSQLLALAPLVPLVPLASRFARFHSTTHVPGWWLIGLALVAVASRRTLRHANPAVGFALTAGTLLASGMALWLL